MKKWLALLLLALVLCLWGCHGNSGTEQPVTEEIEQTEQTEASLYFPDGNPENVTCKGTYTGDVTDAVVARIGDAELTNGELQVWYWAVSPC